MDFWIIIDQRHAGPFSLEQLREQEITPDRLVWHDGLTDWTPAREVEALAKLFAVPAPPPMPETAPVYGQPSPAGECPPPSSERPPVSEATAAASECAGRQSGEEYSERQAPAAQAPNPEFHYGGYAPRSDWQQQQQPDWQQTNYQQPGYQQPPYGGQPQTPYGPQQPQYAPGQQPYGGGVPPCPPTYLVWAIIVTVCCCTPLGIVAIIYAANIKNAYYRGDYAKAQRNSSRAQAWIIAAIVLGLLYIPVQIIYFGLLDMF